MPKQTAITKRKAAQTTKLANKEYDTVRRRGFEYLQSIKVK